MDVDEIARRLLDAAMQRAKANGVRLGFGADQFFALRAPEAARAIIERARNTGAPIEPLVRTAQLAFERLVDEMLAARKDIPGYIDRHPGVIGEDTLASAMRRLCPLWPIC